MENEVLKNGEAMNADEKPVVANSALAEGGAIERVYAMYNSTTPSYTYTSGCSIRAGYKNLSGTLGAGSFTTVFLWDVLTNRTIACTANINTLESYGWDGKDLIVNVGRDSAGNNVYRVTIYNPTSSSKNLAGLRVDYIAIQNA